jgi:hypothetical protein
MNTDGRGVKKEKKGEKESSPGDDDQINDWTVTAKHVRARLGSIRMPQARH